MGKNISILYLEPLSQSCIFISFRDICNYICYAYMPEGYILCGGDKRMLWHDYVKRIFCILMNIRSNNQLKIVSLNFLHLASGVLALQLLWRAFDMIVVYIEIITTY